MVDVSADIKAASAVLGQEKTDCLTSLFEELCGTPPRVEKKRYRANHPPQMDTLDYLEHSSNLIETVTHETQQFYCLRPYAIPLIKSPKAQKLLRLMCKLYKQLPIIYKERLDEGVTREELLNMVDAGSGETLEALHYLVHSHNVWVGRENGFPYEENSQIFLSEKVLETSDFLDVLTQYYRWHFISEENQTLHEKMEFIPPKTTVEDKKVGRPSYKEMIVSAYESLDKDGYIEHDCKFSSHIPRIVEAVEKMYGVKVADKTVSAHVGKKFQADKKSIK